MFNLEKARKLLKDNDLDGMVICTQENYKYITGCNAKSLLSRKIGSEVVIVPTKKEKDPIVVISEHDKESFGPLIRYKDIRTFDTWIYFEKQGIPQKTKTFKPAQFDSMSKVVEAIKDIGLDEGNIGFEQSLAPASFYIGLKEALPKAKLKDVTSILYELRSVREPREFNKLRKAVSIMEKAAIASMQIAKEGVTDREIAAVFKKTATDLGAWVAGHNGHVIVSSGPDAGAAHLAGPHPVSTLRNGDILRFDYGINYDGVCTDFARAYIVGEPSERLIKLHETILKANRIIINNIKPGIRFSELFEIGMDVVKEVYPSYVRGHLGHSISYGPNCEEPPFISPKESRVVEENMVLCVEVPFYILGLGGINIEDMVIVQKNGVEELTKMSRDIRLPLE